METGKEDEDNSTKDSKLISVVARSRFWAATTFGNHICLREDCPLTNGADDIPAKQTGTLTTTMLLASEGDTSKVNHALELLFTDFHHTRCLQLSSDTAFQKLHTCVDISIHRVLGGCS